MDITLSREDHEEQEKRRKTRAKKNRWKFVALLIIFPLGFLLGFKLYTVDDFILVAFNYLTSNTIARFTFWIFVSVIVYKLAAVVISKKQSGLANIFLIWCIDAVIRFGTTFLLIMLIEYLIVHFIPYVHWAANLLWLAPGVFLTVKITYEAFMSLKRSIPRDSVAKDALGQMFIGGYAVPYIGSNLPPFPIPLLPFVNVSSFTAAPVQLPITSKIDNQNRPNALSVSLYENKNATQRRQFSLEIIALGELDNTYLEATKHLSPEAQGNYVVDALIQRIQEHTFEELLSRDKVIESKKDKNQKVSLLESIVEEAYGLVNKRLKAVGRRLFSLNVIDPVEPASVLEERNKQARNNINTTGLNAQAKEIMHSSGGTLSFEESRVIAANDEGLIKRTETRVTSSDGSTGANRKKKGGGSGPPINLIIPVGNEGKGQYADNENNGDDTDS